MPLTMASHFDSIGTLHFNHTPACEHEQDGYRFLVDNSTVMESPTIKTMLSTGEGGGFAEAESNTARLQIR